MKKSLKFVIAVVVVVLVLVGIVAGGYNSLVDAQTAVETKQADIQTQLQRRADLIPNFVSTVKGYSKYEQDTLTAVTEARAKVGKANDAESLAKAGDELDKAISIWVNAVTEAYPDLKANSNYIALQDELAGTENRIAVARKDYNEAVQSYNASIKKFPKNILAGIFGFDKAEFFKADENSKTVHNVEF